MHIRKEERSPFPSLESLVAEHLVFTQRERKILLQASQIAERARELLREEYGEGAVESDDMDYLLAGLEHGGKDLADVGRVRTTHLRI